MVLLDKPYQKEPVAGLRGMLDIAVHRRCLDIQHSSAGKWMGGQTFRTIMDRYEEMDAEEAYALCPFLSLIESRPPNDDWSAMSEFNDKMRVAAGVKGMNEWGNNIIQAIRKELFPDRKYL